MHARFSHVLMLFGAILAFVPIVAVDFLLDSYVHRRERSQLQGWVQTLTRQIEANVNEALRGIDLVQNGSPSLCTPTFATETQERLRNSLILRDVLVENADGVQYCDAYGTHLDYSPVSSTLSIPGRTETLTVVNLNKLDVPALKVTRLVGKTRLLSVFVPLFNHPRAALAWEVPTDGTMHVRLTDGTTVLTMGRAAAADSDSAAAVLSAQSFAGELPIKVEASIPFATVRAGYIDLDVSFTAITCLLSASFLMLALRYVRKTRVPAFDLERAIAAGAIRPFYQPVINLRTGELMGCEVLCRWIKRNGEMVPPSKFIDYAEATNLAIPMTLSLMQQVKYELAEICQLMPDIKVSINLFEGHFRDGAIVDDVRAIFSDSAINYRQLVFEITERRPLNNSTTAMAVIGGLHALGARLAMDDAGTGHSNLAYLQTLGVDVIKIDKVFVDMIKPGIAQVPVLDALIAMARDLGCEIVAEGVENDLQVRYLRDRGVLQAQGYIFAPALKLSAFRELAMALHALRHDDGRRPVGAAA